MPTTALAESGYRYIPGPLQYSAGVAALPGYRLERIRFLDPVPLGRIERYMDEARLPQLSFCACELRSPAPFTDEGFTAFNRVYVGTLERWGIVKNDENPVARSNVCPKVDPPPVPSFHAFTVAVPSGASAKSFVIAGSGESQEGPGAYKDKTVRYRDVSPDGLREKAKHVLGVMESRMADFGHAWGDTTAVQSTRCMICTRSSPTRS